MLVYNKMKSNGRALEHRPTKTDARHGALALWKFEPCVPLTAIRFYQYKSTLYGASRRIYSTVFFTRLPFLRSGCTSICTATAGGEGL